MKTKRLSGVLFAGFLLLGLAFPLAPVGAVEGASAPRSFTNAFVAMDTCTKPRYPRSDSSLKQQLDLVKAAGYAGIAWTECPPEEARRVAEEAEKRGLRLSAIYCGATLTKSNLIYSPMLRQTMAALKGHGTLVWLHIVGQGVAPSSAEGDDVAVPALRGLAEVAAANGLRVAIYPHTRDWTERVQDAVRVAQKVSHPSLGVTFNLCHCLYVGDEKRIPALLEEAAPSLFMVTLNGADRGAAGGSWNRLIQPLDRGSFDILPLLRKLRELKFTGTVGLQGYGVKGDVAENLSRSMTAWTKYLDQLKESAE